MLMIARELTSNAVQLIKESIKKQKTVPNIIHPVHTQPQDSGDLAAPKFVIAT